MSSTGAKLLVLLGAVAVAVVLFLVLSSDDGDDESTSSTTVTQTQTKTVGKDTSKSAKDKDGAPTVEVKDGAPVGGVKKVKVKTGETVKLRVESDMKGSVHVHGYDKTKNVKAGGSVLFSFPAKFDGRFEVEAHFGKHKQIAEVVVGP